MQTGPGKLAETLVGLMIPPACREDVLGDLHERYTSPRRYIADAMCVVPLLIVSRVRRTTDPQVFLMELFAVYLSFLSAAWFLDVSMFSDRLEIVRLAIPAAIAVLATTLGDAYARPGIPPPRQAVRSAATGMAFAFALEAVLWTGGRELAAPLSILFCGAGLSLFFVSTLRLLFRPHVA